MQTLQDFYLQNPFWVWLGVGGVFVGLDVAIGSGKLIWGGVAAAALAFVNLAGVRLGGQSELGIFAAVALGGVLAATLSWKPKPSAATPHDPVPAAKPAKVAKAVKTVKVEDEPPVADDQRTGRLIGRIGRTSGEFANGVGRVWIDGSEWGAELDGAEFLPPDTPVRIMGVTGGVRLHVRNLMA
jgi:membrane protein implicated in regulation of membrane protease activity